MEMGDQFTDFDLSHVSVLPRPRRRRSKVFVLPMLLIGGLMGILAGYGALSLMGAKGFGPSKEPSASVEPTTADQRPAPPAERQRPKQVLRHDLSPPVPPVVTHVLPADEGEPLPRVVSPEPTLPEKQLPRQTVRLKLEKTMQREAITLKGNIKIVEIDGCGYKLRPESGKLPVEVVLEGPRPVTLNVSIEKGMLEIEPSVKNDAGKSIPFTTKNLDLLLRRIMKKGTSAANQLASLKAEQAKLKANLDARVPMAYLDYKAANARVKQLDGIIPQAEQAIVPLETEAKATQRLADFAHQLDGKCAITIESSSED